MVSRYMIDSTGRPWRDPRGLYVWHSDYDNLAADFLALKEYCAALESREVCTVAHEDVETCGYCQRDALSKDAERYRWLRANNSSDGKFCISIEDDDDPSVTYSGHSPIELDGIIDAAMEGR